MEPKTTCKRIVSKGEYTANVGRKAAHSSLGVSLILLGGIGLAVVGMVLLLSLWMMTRNFDATMLLPLAIVVPILSFGSWYVLQIGIRTCSEAAKMEAGVLLTRANTSNLPALESLVRASEEPIQAQKAVLLRAATSGTETPTEQLLRPAGEQE